MMIPIKIAISTAPPHGFMMRSRPQMNDKIARIDEVSAALPERATEKRKPAIALTINQTPSTMAKIPVAPGLIAKIKPIVIRITPRVVKPNIGEMVRRLNSDATIQIPAPRLMMAMVQRKIFKNPAGKAIRNIPKIKKMTDAPILALIKPFNFFCNACMIPPIY